METELKTKKPWWKSKTIIAIGGTVLGAYVAKPPQTKQDWLQFGVVLGGGALAGVFRKTASKNL